LVRCPICGREFDRKPFKTWKFRFYDVKRYECKLCESKFNSYESPGSIFTIPKARH